MFCLKLIQLYTILLVMVFVHGGGFTSGAGTTDAYGPERLLDYGVVSEIFIIFCLLNLELFIHKVVIFSPIYV
jgi:hypothetical protein